MLIYLSDRSRILGRRFSQIRIEIEMQQMKSSSGSLSPAVAPLERFQNNELGAIDSAAGGKAARSPRRSNA
ncbi:hypothetical protein QMZ05_20470 [Bradyrhizobium sp. INPA03-11B]|uniref:hypothetical protein n=1 Tax=Bradyrhizobium sp. INPA03-11B TaxID=418598 RepID=UPI00338DA2E3